MIKLPHVRLAVTTQNILVMAVWFGLVTGLVEGVGLWSLQQLGWLRGAFTFLGSGPEILWISPLFDLLLFGLVGVELSLLARLLPRWPILFLAFFAFAFLLLFDWLALPLNGYISIYAIFILALGLAVEATRWFGKYQETLLRFGRNTLPWLVGVALLVVVTIPGGLWLREQLALARLPIAPAGSPNILVIVIDTLRADHLSGYGYDRPTSPNLDRLAENGVLFENTFATSSWTQPSHASLLTGHYPYEHRADNFKPLDNHYPTIGEVFQKQGYRTGAFSANYEVFNRQLGFGRGFHHFEDYYQSMTNMISNTLYGRSILVYGYNRGLGLQSPIDQRRASDINHALLRWIDQDRTHPFFVFLNYFDAHDPYQPPQPFRGMFSQSEEPGGLINSKWDTNHIYQPLTPEQLQGEIDAYDGAIAYIDHNIRDLLVELDDRGLAKDTLLVITSDHGESFGEHGLFQHANSLYREVIHVPLIFYWPGHIPADIQIPTPVTNAALPATLLDLLADDNQTLFPGPSLAQLWETPSLDQAWPYPLAEVAQLDWVPPQHLPYHGAMKAVISPQWHYVTHDKFGEELYAWPDDPVEASNLAVNPDFQSILEQFRTGLQTLVAGITSRSK